jgi:hypothetical protein
MSGRRWMPRLALAACLLAPVAGRTACDCGGVPFRAARSAKLGLEAQVLQSVLVNEHRGKLKVGARAFMPATTNLTGDRIYVGAEASVGSVNANIVRFHPLATVAGPVVGPLTLPVVDPLCPLTAGTCGTEDVTVKAEDGLVTLEPGSYGNVKIGKAAFVRLLPGAYDICNLKVARTGAMINEGPVTMHVVGVVRVAADALVLPATGQPRLQLNVSGPRIVFGLGSVVRAEVLAPGARFKVGRQSSFDGCFCTRDAKIGTEATASCNAIGSASPAFVD